MNVKQEKIAKELLALAYEVKELTRTNIGIWFDKAVCLEIIMRDFFNKIWTDGKWEVKSEH